MDYLEFQNYQEGHLPFGEPELSAADLWYFEHNEARIELLLKSANYYREVIEHNKAYLNVPLGVIFSSDTTCNARATVFKGKGLIVWNAGLLLKQMEVIDKEVTINNAINGTALETILPALDNPANILFFQALQHFTFHHEFAHIIQMQNKETGLIIAQLRQDKFELNKHILEKDADEFSALFLASHIIQYTDRLFNEIDSDIMTKVISLFLVPILTDSISIFPEDIQKVDFEHGLHPHPIARILFVALAIIDVINQRYEGIFKIHSRDVMQQTMEVGSKLTDINLMAMWKQHFAPLMAYYKKILLSEFPKEYLSAIYVWNEEIRQRQNE
jgi:hypothetical protein